MNRESKSQIQGICPESEEPEPAALLGDNPEQTAPIPITGASDLSAIAGTTGIVPEPRVSDALGDSSDQTDTCDSNQARACAFTLEAASPEPLNSETNHNNVIDTSAPDQTEANAFMLETVSPAVQDDHPDPAGPSAIPQDTGASVTLETDSLEVQVGEADHDDAISTTDVSDSAQIEANAFTLDAVRPAVQGDHPDPTNPEEKSAEAAHNAPSDSPHSNATGSNQVETGSLSPQAVVSNPRNSVPDARDAGEWTPVSRASGSAVAPPRSFPFHRSFWEGISELPEGTQLAVCRGLCEFVFDGKLPQKPRRKASIREKEVWSLLTLMLPTVSRDLGRMPGWRGRSRYRF